MLIPCSISVIFYNYSPLYQIETDSVPKLITEKINIKMKHISNKVDRHEVNKLNTVITALMCIK